MFEHKGVHQCMWHQDTLGRRSMIDFVVVSSDLRPYVLDTRVKRGAELSTDHHLVFEVVEARSLVPVVAATPNPVVDTGSKWDAVRLKKESYRTMLACGTPDAVDRRWNTVYSAGGELLTLTGDIVGRWKKYFEDLLNPTDLPSNEEAEAGDAEVDSSITQAEVTEVVRKLLSGKAPGVDEIRPEYLKSLDVVGLSWLTRLCNIAWRLGTVPLEWQTGVVFPLFKKGDRRVCSNYRGITLLSLPGKVYARVLEKENSADSRPSDSGGNKCGFRPSRGTLDQLYTLHRVLEGLWEFAQPVHMCFVDLEKAFDRPCPLMVFCGENSAAVWVSSGAFAKGCSVSVRPEQELGSHCRQTFSMCWSGLQPECEAAGMRISTSKSAEAMVLDQKRVACPLRVGGEVLPQVEEFKYLGVLFTSEGKMEREIDRRIGAASAVQLCGRCTGPCRGGEGAEPKG
ncbi:hypothetical protein L3Q82_002875 [Scortum barcoo]|uniref:Uncharacterized protein n=1 Tax=Scortum barcoo TaxID=214431 RepID=A0ACB8VUH8_9TELE|nr:hypothetical protein L3Q82_002875 [Scortum barcoo]